jgi:hypothetical protein
MNAVDGRINIRRSARYADQRDTPISARASMPSRAASPKAHSNILRAATYASIQLTTKMVAH